jgi:hypothetical protein
MSVWLRRRRCPHLSMSVWPRTEFISWKMNLYDSGMYWRPSSRASRRN